MRLLATIGIAVALWFGLYLLAQRLPMESHTRSRLMHLLAVVLVLIIAGPEIGLGMEGLAALDALGAELFFASLIVGFRMLPIEVVWAWLKSLIESIDPYFLIPSLAQIKDCPSIVSHAIPCFVPICLAFALCGAVELST